MIGSIIGGAMKVGGAIFGGISASRSAKEQKKAVEAQRQKNQDWYDQRYNEDATQRADAQRILTMTEESIKNRNRQAAGSAAVMGGTDESVAAAKVLLNNGILFPSPLNTSTRKRVEVFFPLQVQIPVKSRQICFFAAFRSAEKYKYKRGPKITLRASRLIEYSGVVLIRRAKRQRP